MSIRSHSRPSLRLSHWDYNGYGWYHVTICVQRKECIFGDIIHGEMYLNVCGIFVDTYFRLLPFLYRFVHVDEMQLMPNHLHVVLEFADGSGIPFGRFIPYGDPSLWKVTGKRKSLSNFIAAFKTVTTRSINVILNFPRGTKIWQRNYYERIIRSEEEREQVHRYIRQNPAQWEQDEENPRVVV